MDRIVKNIASNVFNFVISIIIPIFLTPFLIHKLGDSRYGLWILINSVVGYYGLLELGISSSIIRYVSKYTATGDEDDLNSFVNTVLLVFVIVSIAAIIGSGVMSFFLADLFNLSEEDSALFSRLILVLGITFAVMLLGRTFTNMLRAIQRYDIANTIDISCSVAQAVMTVCFLSLGRGLIALGLTNLSIGLVNSCFSFFFALRKLPMLKIDLGRARKSKLRTVFGYSVFIFIWAIGDRLRFHMDSIVIGAFLSAGAITYYSIGARLMVYYVEAIGAFCSVARPIFSSMEARDQYEKIRNLLINGTRYLSLIAVFIGVSLILYGRPFIRLWIGEGYESSYYVMLILTIPYMVDLSQHMLILAVRGIGRHRFPSLVSIGEGVLNLGLSILLVRRYGIYGVALGTAAPMLIMMLFVHPVYICRAVKLPISRYITKGLLPQLPMGILYGLIGRTATSVFHPSSYARLFLSISVGFVFFAVLAITFSLTGDERRFGGNWIAAQAEKIHSRI